MKQSKTTIGELQKRYRAVLLKCFLAAAASFCAEAANAASYVSEGGNMKRFGVEAGAGVSFKVGDTDVGVSYEGKFREHYTDHTGMINVRYDF